MDALTRVMFVVDNLNQLAHVPVIAPESANLDPDAFVAPGADNGETVDHSGTVKFQCCIHSWMRLEAHVRSRKRGLL